MTIQTLVFLAKILKDSGLEGDDLIDKAKKALRFLNPKASSQKIDDMADFIGGISQPDTSESPEEREERLKGMYKESKKAAKERTMGFMPRFANSALDTAGDAAQLAGNLAGMGASLPYQAMVAAGTASGGPTTGEGVLGVADPGRMLTGMAGAYSQVPSYAFSGLGDIANKSLTRLGNDIYNYNADKQMQKNQYLTQEEWRNQAITPSQSQVMQRLISSNAAAYKNNRAAGGGI